jgi:hypothetical protein
MGPAVNRSFPLLCLLTEHYKTQMALAHDLSCGSLNRRAEVEVEVEVKRRADSFFLSLSLNLNLPIYSASCYK